MSLILTSRSQILLDEPVEFTAPFFLAGLITGPSLAVQPRHGSVGQLIPMTQARLLDSSGIHVPLEAGRSPGRGRVRGELLVRGPQVCLGYLNNEEATREAFDSDGYIRYVILSFYSLDP